MSDRITAAPCAQQVSAATFTGIAFEPRPTRLSDDRAERERRIALYTAQLRGSHIVKRRQICFGGALARAVRCIDQGRNFDSVGHAARELGLKPASIRAAIRNRGRTAGVRFCYTGEPRRISNRRSRPILCVTTNEAFDSMTEASRAHAVPISTLFGLLKSGRESAHRRRYEYAPAEGESKVAA